MSDTPQVDWNEIARVVTEHWEQTGQWVSYEELISPLPISPQNSLTLDLTAADFRFIYTKGGNDPLEFLGAGTFSQEAARQIQANGEYGYSVVFGGNERGLLDAEFVVDPNLSQHLVFNGPGADAIFVVGRARLAADFIARPWEADPTNPSELEIAIQAVIGGTTVALGSVPDVKTGVALGGAANSAGRGGRADVNLEGTTASVSTDFRAGFNPEIFTVNGHTFLAEIRDIVFDSPAFQPPLQESPVYIPVDEANIFMTLTYLGDFV